jgi:hypothetical protein
MGRLMSRSTASLQSDPVPLLVLGQAAALVLPWHDAIGTRQPGGTSYAELSNLLRALLASGLAVGMEIAIFDPELDPDGSIARGAYRGNLTPSPSQIRT